MSHRNSRSKKVNKAIAKNRIERLFILAEKCALHGKFGLSNRYVFFARKISMRYLVPIPEKYKRNFCKHCYSYLIPVKNCRVRISRSKIIISCFNCKKYCRIPLK
jgi:ribonuclease P protein subunit RPR2